MEINLFFDRSLFQTNKNFNENSQNSQDISDTHAKNYEENPKDHSSTKSDNTSPSNPVDKKNILKTEVNNEPKSVENTQTPNGLHSNTNKPSEASGSLIDPVLASTVEDINKYYKPELLYRLTGIDLNEVNILV